MDEQWWVPHPDELFLPGKLLKARDDESTYQTEAGVVTVPAADAAKLEHVAHQVLSGVNDICGLDSINDAVLLHSVRLRYARDDIYTNVSRILVAINPFKSLNIYEDQYIERYRSAGDPSTLPPHVFGVGADVYQRFAEEGKSQAVLISGESGAGKTESTKLVLLYVSQAFSGSGKTSEGLEDKLLEINPILEAFGNAKTGRNNNSSRFGKWIEVLLNPVTMSIAGADVTDYLLEVTRVCSQGPGERNYHIFYQLALDDSGDLAQLKLAGGAERFAYLNKNPARVAEINDREDLNMLRKAIVGLKFSKEEQDSIFTIVAGILHLGNIAFTPDADKTSIANEEILQQAAELFGCDPKELTRCVCCKRLTVGKDITLSPIGHEKAGQARDSIAKLIYSRLFKWLIVRCNQALGMQRKQDEGGGKALPFVGVLDIAGFESFVTNSLEQLFINLSNEKLQHFFNNYVFKTELEEYKAEGVEFGAISYADNADILTLVEGKGGLLTMLDDATTGIKQTDATYVAAVVKAHEKNKHFVKPKFPNQPLFTVRHFAGDVIYTADGFLEKNIAQQPPEVLDMMANSKSIVLKELAQEPEPPTATAAAAAGAATSSRGSMRSAKKATVGTTFRRSLQQLVDKFSDARAHFIRCVKPNTAKLPGKFESKLVLDQMRLSGLMEAVKIRKAGFPIRQLAADFVKRYLVILPRVQRTKLRNEPDTIKASKALLDGLVKMLVSKVKEQDYAVGKSKVFLRENVYRILESCRRLAFAEPVLLIQKVFRGYHIRTIMEEVRETSNELQKILASAGLSRTGNTDESCSVIEKQKRATVMEGSVRTLDILLKHAESLKIKLPIFQQALVARARIAAESNIARQMQTLTSSASLDLPAMEAVLARSLDYNMAGEVVDALRKRSEALKVQLPLSRSLGKSEGMDLGGLRELVAEARGSGLDVEGAWVVPGGFQAFARAAARVEQLEEEERAAEEARREAAAAAEAAAKAAAEAAEQEEARRVAREAAEQAAAQARGALMQRIDRAAKEFDACELQEAFSDAEGHGMEGEAGFPEAHALFLQLQSGSFLQARLAEMRRKASSEPIDILIMSNLIKQHELLGLPSLLVSEERRGVTDSLVQSRRSRRASSHSADSLQAARAARRCFEDLSNFSGLQDLQEWNWKSGHQEASDAAAAGGLAGLPDMLKWSPDRLLATVTEVDPEFATAGLRNFANVQRCMGDKPAPKIGNKELPILVLAQRVPALQDEIFVQIMKQLTANPSVESATKGWHLLRSLCQTVSPSPELCEFLRAFLQRGMRGEEAAETRGTSGSSPSPCQVAESRRQSCVQMREDYLTELPKLAAEALQFFEERDATSGNQDAAESSPSQGQLVEVQTEDGTCWTVRVKQGWTLEELFARMLTVLRISDGVDFEFFAAAPDEMCVPWRLLPRTLEVDDAVSQMAQAGHTLMFGRINLSAEENLSWDDLEHARLSFHHAVRQYLCYQLALPGDLVPETSVALVSADCASFAHKKGGRRLRRLMTRQMEKELGARLLGEGVIERYVPAEILRKYGREAMAEQVMALAEKDMDSLGEDDGSSELLARCHALATMQANVPSFDAYVWEAALQSAASAVRWEDIQWYNSVSEASTTDMPLPAWVTDDGGEELPRLAITREGIELQRSPHLPPAGESVSFPFCAFTAQCFLSDWSALPDDLLALKVTRVGHGQDAPSCEGVVFQLPRGGAEAAAALLSRFDSETTF